MVQPRSASARHGHAVLLDVPFVAASDAWVPFANHLAAGLECAVERALARAVALAPADEPGEAGDAWRSLVEGRLAVVRATIVR